MRSRRKKADWSQLCCWRFDLKRSVCAQKTSDVTEWNHFCEDEAKIPPQPCQPDSLSAFWPSCSDHNKKRETRCLCLTLELERWQTHPTFLPHLFSQIGPQMVCTDVWCHADICSLCRWYCFEPTIPNHFCTPDVWMRSQTNRWNTIWAQTWLTDVDQHTIKWHVYPGRCQ